MTSAQADRLLAGIVDRVLRRSNGRDTDTDTPREPGP